MKPVVTVAEMREIDAVARSEGLLDELVERAGWSVARQALRMLGGTYGRRVCVIAGRGNNGADGKVAAERLAERGAQASVLSAAERPDRLDGYDLVIDAAYGTGFRGEYRAPVVNSSTKVLAVDIPSGVDGDSGSACDGAVVADETVTFAAYKPGLLLGDGPLRSGSITVADIGLDVSSARAHLVEPGDVDLPPRERDAHKWGTAISVVAGSAGMMGAAMLTASAAMRAGSGMVRLGVPGAVAGDLPVSEVVARCLPEEGWEDDMAGEIARCRVLVVGPGLGRAESTAASIRALVAASPVPVVVDADGIVAFSSPEELGKAVSATPGRVVIVTPHDGEFGSLTGAGPGPDRLSAVRDLAARSGAVVLLKGPTTVVAEPGGDVLLSDAGGPVLATAGSGDVLTGVIAAFVARGLDPLRAAGFAAYVHGAASCDARARGLVAGDLLRLIPRWMGRRGGGSRPSHPSAGAGRRTRWDARPCQGSDG